MHTTCRDTCHVWERHVWLESGMEQGDWSCGGKDKRMVSVVAQTGRQVVGMVTVRWWVNKGMARTW